MQFKRSSLWQSSLGYSEPNGSNGQTIEPKTLSQKLSDFTSKLARKLRRFLCFLVVLARPLRDADWLSYAKESAKSGRFKLNAPALAAHA
jgi:hypothetical protein